MKHQKLRRLKNKNMLKASVYSIKGRKVGSISLPREFDEKVNLRLLAQAIRVYEERGHIGLAKAKTRSEVNRTKKKWYKQKGTGGARHGARSAPIFVGGGVAHGPRPTQRGFSLPGKMRKKARAIALSAKVKNKEVVAVDGLSKLGKTAEAKGLVDKLSKEGAGAKRFTFILSGENLKAKTFIRNLKNAKALSYKDLNAYDVFLGGMLILDKEIFSKKARK